MKRGRPSYKIASAKDVPSACKVIFANIVRTIMILPTVPLLRVILLLVKIAHAADRTQRQTVQQQVTERLIQRRIIERQIHNESSWAGWDAPIYDR